MYEIKNKGKSVLIEYDLSVDVFEKFNLKVEDVIPLRNVFFLKCESGEKVLKKVDYSLEELRFIHTAVKYIKRNFTRIVDLEEIEDGEVYIKHENQVYCIMEYVQGRECEFNNPIDIKTASRGLSEFHKASEGLKCNITNRNNCGKIINVFQRRLEEVNFFKSIVNKFEHKNEFDEIFLNNIEYYKTQIDKSIDILNKSQYYKLSSEEDKIALCHHDLAHHNILIKDDLAYFVDMDYSILDLKVHDICNFINKVIKNFAYDFSKAEIIINEYCSLNKLSNEEIQVLYGMLYFPNDFYDISRNYYTRRKSWEEEVFINKLKKKVGAKEDNAEFLKEFNQVYLK